jgi:hypothetical protein
VNGDRVHAVAAAVAWDGRRGWIAQGGKDIKRGDWQGRAAHPGGAAVGPLPARPVAARLPPAARPGAAGQRYP